MYNFAIRTLVCLATVCCALTDTVQASDAPKLRVATFQVDATPPLNGHPLIWVTQVKTVETPLLAKGIVIDDGAKRYVICSLDWCGLCNSTHDLFRSKLAAGAGTDISRVAVQTVHQHTAPYTDSDAQRLIEKTEKAPLFADLKFLDDLTDRLAAAVKKSLDELQPFDSIGTGEAKVDRVASSRRIITPDGKFHGRMSSTKNPLLQALPEGHIDPMLKTITLAQGDKPLVRMHYYATHPQSFYGDPRTSYDTAGFARERLQEKEGVFQIYFNGCGGDVAMGKYNNASREARDELTDRLFAGMAASAASTKLQPVGQLKWRTVDLLLPAREESKEGQEKLVAQYLATMADAKANPVKRCRAACRVAFNRRIERPILINSLEFGNVHMLHLPGECMVDYQLYAQSVKPKDFVAVAAYGDLAPGYICTEKSFSEGGYEPSASRAGRTTEPVLKAAIRELLGSE